MQTPVLFMKSHVDGYTRKDGVTVRAHDTKVQAANPDIGAGCWRVGHKVKIHVPSHALHGKEGTVTGRSKRQGWVDVKHADGSATSVSGYELRPADGYHWPDVETSVQEKKPAPAPMLFPKAALDPHPDVIGKVENDKGHQFDFDGKRYIQTGEEGTSLHDGGAVKEYWATNGHRVWKDDQGRVHAASREEARRVRGEN
jgi:hypothetical protein